MTPIPTEWWLRPLSNAARVGAHNAVVWKRLYLRPLPASRSAVGVAHGPPNALDAPKPTSSSRTTSTFGAPCGGRSGSIGGNVAPGSLASRGSSPSYGLSGIGRTSRELWSVTLYSSLGHARAWGLSSGRRLLGARRVSAHQSTSHPRGRRAGDHHALGTSVGERQRGKPAPVASSHRGLPDCRTRIVRELA